ncbi:MAG: efflux transporter periplasmic adaptor subunit [Betaproteobacteria bacterium HGW-Betaproteobacteria-12]|nr:MAG: efflux transporter periplasmic adaptor subunit [Betaproteobacteria bacterium HGW-Betaproteobacteria-12]
MKLPLSGSSAKPLAAAALALLALAFIAGCADEGSADTAPPAAKPALTVSLVTPTLAEWPGLLVANGNVVAWQEAVIGAEVANYRIAEVRVEVGDRVRRGDVLARIASDTVASELAEASAAAAEAEAAVAEATGNAERARELLAKGFYSTQLHAQYQSAERMAAARLAAARARQQAAQLKMNKTAVLAPDDGLISARRATVGSLTQPGEELFRLIRGGRLEWRAEVPSADLLRVPVGTVARLTGPNGGTVSGTVRAVAPSVDAQTRNGLIYVDLPATDAVRAGMFARGEFELGRTPALSLPQTAVVLREGFAYVFRLEGTDRVAQTKVELGRRAGERVEILAGLKADVRVVENGAGFLADGDVVKVVAGSQQP